MCWPWTVSLHELLAFRDDSIKEKLYLTSLKLFGKMNFQISIMLYLIHKKTKENQWDIEHE